MDNSTSSEILSWIKVFLVAFVLSFFCHHFLFTSTMVHGESMEPNFSNDDRIIISKNTSIERFDVIVFDAPETDENYIKRVIGLPGDRIEMKNDTLYINGEPYDETYLQEIKSEYSFGKFTGDFTLEEITGETIVPEGSLFVLGDNRMKSLDSRRFGFISYDSVVGEVKFRYFPIPEVGFPE